MSDGVEAHLQQVAAAMIRDGRVVPLLGAGANLCDREGGEVWDPEAPFLPNAAELATHLASRFSYPEQSRELIRVSQYVSVQLGDQPLYEALHGVFAGEYEPTTLHHFLASVPALVAAQPKPPRDRFQLIVTTNYDDALEAAFDEKRLEYDLVSYIADGDDVGRFVHRTPDGHEHVIERPNEYGALSLEQRTVILKVHGAVHRTNSEQDSYVITEDNYIDYLTRTDVSTLLPVTLAAKIRQSHILFLGYSLSDWNLRAIFHRIWRDRRRGSKSWAINLGTNAMEQKFWGRRDVELLDMRLDRYVAGLAAAARELTADSP